MKLYRSRPHYRSYSTIRPEAIQHLFSIIIKKPNSSRYIPIKHTHDMGRDHSIVCYYNEANIMISRILYYQHPINGRIPCGMGMINSTNMSYRYLRLHQCKSGMLDRYPYIKKRMRLKIGLVYIYLHKFRRKA